MTFPGYAELLARARFPGDARTLAFAGVIGRALASGASPLIRGMTERDFQRLLGAFFPGVSRDNGGDALKPSADHDEHAELLGLLLEHRAEASEVNTWLCHAVASAAMNDEHLWQDMGLPNRSVLTQLLEENFPALAALNSGDMKWKKFLYRQLCQRAGVPICKSPNCSDCSDYGICFGPEAAEDPAVMNFIGANP